MPYYRTISCGFTITRDITRNELVGEIGSTSKIFPNPIQKGGTFNLQFSNQDGNAKIARLVSIDGKEMLRRKLSSNEGQSSFQLQADPRWPAGTYFLQLLYENGKILASNKVINQ
jgi:hypothetical protein